MKLARYERRKAHVKSSLIAMINDEKDAEWEERRLMMKDWEK